MFAAAVFACRDFFSVSFHHWGGGGGVSRGEKLGRGGQQISSIALSMAHPALVYSILFLMPDSAF